MLSRILSNYFPGLMVASVPFAGWSLFNVGDTFSFTASYVVSFIVLIINLPLLIIKFNYKIDRHFFTFYGPLIAGCIFSFVSLFFWDYANFLQYFLSLIHLCFFVLVTYCLLQVPNIDKALNFYAAIYTFIGVLVAIIGLVDLIFVLTTGSGLGVEFNTIARTIPSDTKIGSLPRASSIFFEPGWFAHYLLINIILIMAWLLPRANMAGNKLKILSLQLSLILMLMALIATLSASAYLVLGMIILFFILNRPKPIRTLIFIIFIFFLLSLIPFPNDLPNPLAATAERFFGLLTGNHVAGESVDARSGELAAAYKIFADTMFLGSGYGQSAYYISSATDVGTGGISSFYGILMAETGLIGLLAFVGSIVMLNYKLWRQHKIVMKNCHYRAQIIFCAQCMILAETIFLNFFSAMASATYVTSFWFALLVVGARGGISVNSNHPKKG